MSELKFNQYTSRGCRIGDHHRCQDVTFYYGWPDCECFCHAKNNTNDPIETPLMLSEILYGDEPPATRRQIFLWKWRNRFARIGDAWLLLTGKAHIE